MVMQPRAVATRELILDIATELFRDIGYGNTSLAEIIDRCRVTKGAFYYHFSGKEAVAAALIEEADATIQRDGEEILATESSALQNLIHASFHAASLTDVNPRVRVGNLLRQALNQVSPAASATYTARYTTVVKAVKAAVAEGNLVPDTDPEEVAHTIWASQLGTRLLCDATGQDVYTHFAQTWRVILRANVPAPSLPYFTTFVEHIASTYRDQSGAAQAPAV